MTNIGYSEEVTTTKKSNEYALLQFKKDYSNVDDKEGTQKFQTVVFYEMYNDKDGYANGTTIEEMLRVSIERLEDLNGRFSCRENSIAITKMQEALLWLNERTRDREARDVEGKHLK
jgi:hypothetical protein|tara:strand:+ start:1688 stop:2038 length:351 start_codon:yes stop_codon:yes gene_type:complete